MPIVRVEQRLLSFQHHLLRIQIPHVIRPVHCRGAARRCTIPGSPSGYRSASWAERLRHRSIVSSRRCGRAKLLPIGAFSFRESQPPPDAPLETLFSKLWEVPTLDDNAFGF